MEADNAFWQWVFVAGLFSIVCTVLLGMLLKAPAVSAVGGGASTRLRPRVSQARSAAPSAMYLGAMVGAEHALFAEDALGVSSACDLFDDDATSHFMDDASLLHDDHRTDPLFAHEIDNIWHGSCLDTSQTNDMFSSSFDDFGCSFGDDD